MIISNYISKCSEGWHINTMELAIDLDDIHSKGIKNAQIIEEINNFIDQYEPRISTQQTMDDIWDDIINYWLK